MIAVALTELRVDTRERLHSVLSKADPFQRRGLPCELVVEIDVLGPAGMRAVMAEKDPFQWASPFPKFVYPNGMSVTEWDRTLERVL